MIGAVSPPLTLASVRLICSPNPLDMTVQTAESRRHTRDR